MQEVEAQNQQEQPTGRREFRANPVPKLMPSPNHPEIWRPLEDDLGEQAWNGERPSREIMAFMFAWKCDFRFPHGNNRIVEFFHELRAAHEVCKEVMLDSPNHKTWKSIVGNLSTAYNFLITWG